MQPKDYYQILGVAETATPEDIKKTYRKIARENHPDRNPGNAAAEERFKEASEAYEILSNPEKRRKYDALRRYGFAEAGFGGQGGPGFGQGFPGGFDPRRGGFRVHVNQGNLHESDFADIFSEESPFSSLFEQLFDQMRVQRPDGRPGAGPGGRARARASRNGGPDPLAGDSFFRREGLDVHCTVWLRLDQLEKGAKVKVRTPSGKKVVVRVPADTRIGAVLRVPGMGLNGPGRTGDQYVHVEAVE